MGFWCCALREKHHHVLSYRYSLLIFIFDVRLLTMTRPAISYKISILTYWSGDVWRKYIKVIRKIYLIAKSWATSSRRLWSAIRPTGNELLTPVIICTQHTTIITGQGSRSYCIIRKKRKNDTKTKLIAFSESSERNIIITYKRRILFKSIARWPSVGLLEFSIEHVYLLFLTIRNFYFSERTPLGTYIC